MEFPINRRICVATKIYFDCEKYNKPASYINDKSQDKRICICVQEKDITFSHLISK
jgi:hypothetical protein